MKSYNFSMERVLEWRENQEKDSMEKFAFVQSELHYEKSVLTGFTNEYESIKGKRLSYKTINELKHYQLYKQSIEDEIAQQNQVIDRKNIELEKMRLELISAQKDRKIMEKLKERDFFNYQEEANAAEQRELDEMAILKFKRTL